MENHIANYDHHGNYRKFIDNYCAQSEIHSEVGVYCVSLCSCSI